jgi:hypothetical protein
MRSVGIVLILFFITVTSYSQKVQIIDQSNFRHNYVVSALEFIETPIDTPRLKYIATLSFSGKQDYLLTVAGWHDLIKIKAKSLGANSYLVQEYTENESSIELKLKFYFGSMNFLKSNKTKRESNSVIVFNQTRISQDTGCIYLNDQKINFDPTKSYAFQIEPLKTYYLTTANSDFATSKISFKKDKSSLFYIMPGRKSNFKAYRSIFNENIPVAVNVNGVLIYFGGTAPYKLNYQQGRFLLAVYK